MDASTVRVACRRRPFSCWPDRCAGAQEAPKPGPEHEKLEYYTASRARGRRSRRIPSCPPGSTRRRTTADGSRAASRWCATRTAADPSARRRASASWATAARTEALHLLRSRQRQDDPHRRPERIGPGRHVGLHGRVEDRRQHGQVPLHDEDLVLDVVHVRVGDCRDTTGPGRRSWRGRAPRPRRARAGLAPRSSSSEARRRSASARTPAGPHSSRSQARWRSRSRSCAGASSSRRGRRGSRSTPPKGRPSRRPRN